MGVNMKLISIVIPFYNAEKYITDCIISIQSQSYSDFEVIFVNDGSSDKSEEIVRDFMERDKRIKYFYQKKSGVGKARNYVPLFSIFATENESLNCKLK